MKRKTYTPIEKAKMVLEALRGERTVNEIASANEVHPKMLSRWKREAESNLYILFQDDTARKRKEEKVHEEELQALVLEDRTVDHSKRVAQKSWPVS